MKDIQIKVNSTVVKITIALLLSPLALALYGNFIYRVLIALDVSSGGAVLCSIFGTIVVGTSTAMVCAIRVCEGDWPWNDG